MKMCRWAVEISSTYKQACIDLAGCGRSSNCLPNFLVHNSKHSMTVITKMQPYPSHACHRVAVRHRLSYFSRANLQSGSYPLSRKDGAAERRHILRDPRSKDRQTPTVWRSASTTPTDSTPPPILLSTPMLNSSPTVPFLSDNHPTPNQDRIPKGICTAHHLIPARAQKSSASAASLTWLGAVVPCATAG